MIAEEIRNDAVELVEKIVSDFENANTAKAMDIAVVRLLAQNVRFNAEMAAQVADINIALSLLTNGLPLTVAVKNDGGYALQIQEVK